jgi:hypothetical protein
MYAVFKFSGDNAKIREMYQNDIVGRQSIVKRDAKSLGMKGNEVYVVVEGTEDAIEEARKIAGEFELKGPRALEIYERIKKAEEEVSLGMGAIFG